MDLLCVPVILSFLQWLLLLALYSVVIVFFSIRHISFVLSDSCLMLRLSISTMPRLVVLAFVDITARFVITNVFACMYSMVGG